jgi:hypothetical protein
VHSRLDEAMTPGYPISETFHTTGNTHQLVVEPGPERESIARGLNSCTRLERQIGKLKEGTARDRLQHRDRLSPSIA